MQTQNTYFTRGKNNTRVLSITLHCYYVIITRETCVLRGFWCITERVVDHVASLFLQTYGGNSMGVKLYRAYFEALTSISDMWQGNPVLTTVLFGLPSGFLCLICYSIFCADIMDAYDDDEEEEQGEHLTSVARSRDYVNFQTRLIFYPVKITYGSLTREPPQPDPAEFLQIGFI